MTTKGVAIITGATGGIGYCIARGLAEDGYKTILLARNEAGLNAAGEELAKLVSDALKPETVLVDLMDHKHLVEVTERLIAHHCPVAILVNCAGQWLGGTLDESEEHFTRLLEINLVAPFTLMKAVAKSMQGHGTGYIFNIASRSGVHGFPGSGLYSASKFGLVGLTESLYRELAARGVKVTSIIAQLGQYGNGARGPFTAGRK